MSLFFAERPVFAWVVALFIALAGTLTLTNMPIAQYPSVAPPAVVITATWPGATAELVDNAVTSVIEQELNSAEGLLYMESESLAGRAQITVSFTPESDPQLAMVEVQNLVKRVEARLPNSVQQQGVQIQRTSSSFLLFVSLQSTDGQMDSVSLGDFLNRRVINEIRRVKGVGEALVLGTEHAMRIWLKPEALVSYDLTASDVVAAIRAQNRTVSAGTLGDLPNPEAQATFVDLTVQGQLERTEEFGDIIVRSDASGAIVRLRDVARVELGAQSYAINTRTNGKASSSFGVRLAPGANGLETAQAVRARVEDLSKSFPDGVRYILPLDRSTFIQLSVESVLHTLGEAMILVFLVMFVFLQNVRATLIPAIVVPVALLGSIATLYAFGYSINVLTMFGMVLAIGILVDDAIVVVENVERIMAEEHLPPLAATRKAMGQIQGAIVGITLVLIVVFLPMGLFDGAVGVIYRQFTVTMASSILFSAVLALSLTPALCATVLKPHTPGHKKNALFRGFDRAIDGSTRRYTGWVAAFVARTGRAGVLFILLTVLAGWMYARLPGGFLPDEDQGSVLALIQLPPGASQNRTDEVVRVAEEALAQNESVKDYLTIQGFSHVGRGQNAALAFITLKDWDERSQSAMEVVGQLNGTLSQVRDAQAFALNPPPIRELGNASGFTFRLEDRGGVGHEALLEARGRLLAAASQSPILQGVRPEGLEDASQIALKIDREKADTLGVAYGDIADTLGIAYGSSYINDFPRAGRQQQVIVQAEAAARMSPDDIAQLHVRNASGGMVSLDELTHVDWTTGPVQLVRYNGYPAMRIAGSVAPGYSTGEGMAEMERLASELGDDFGYEWTGQSYEEAMSSDQASALLGLSMLVVFLCLAALYESWSIPSSVLLVVPLGFLGALVSTTIRGMPNDVYFKIGLITVIGLSAKNAILIVEFAKDLQAEGKALIAATVEAAQLRFRPIVMTSLAFTLGVVPLVFSTGAGSGSQQAIGTAVFGGMILGTVLSVMLVPVFFVVLRSWFPDKRKKDDASPPSAPKVESVTEPKEPAHA